MEDFNGTTGVVEDEDGDTLTTALSCFSKSLESAGRGGARRPAGDVGGTPPPGSAQNLTPRLAGSCLAVCPVPKQFTPAGS